MMLRRAILIALLGSSLAAQTLIQTETGTATWKQHGAGVARMDDANGDGIPEFAVSGITAVAGQGLTSYVRVYSGSDGTLLDSVSPLGPFLATPNGLLETNLISIDDVNSDGITDLVMASYQIPSAGAGVFTLPGSVCVLSGVDLSLLYVINGLSIGDDFGRALGTVEDLDGDGAPEVIIGAPQVATFTGTGYFSVYSGATGSFWLGFAGTSPGEQYGASVAGLDDVNGDGVNDLVVGAPSPFQFLQVSGSRYQVLSGADGTLIHQDSSTSHGLGLGLARISDHDGDGVDDFCVASPNQIDIISGVGGFSLSASSLPAGFFQSTRMRTIGDLDGDGARDVVLVSGDQNTAHVLAYSPGNGPLFTKTFPLTHSLRPVVASVADMGDMTSNGLSEIVIGVRRSDAFGFGAAQIFSVSNPGQASATSLGASYSATGLSMNLTSPAPIIDTDIQLELLGAQPSGSGFLLTSFVPPAPLQLAPGLVLRLDPLDFANWAVTPISADASGNVTLPLSLPGAMSLMGLDATLQAWFPGPGGLTSGHVSNGLYWVLGY